uniref:5-hydroxytryptamine (serotonin) receptor 3B n=1 Tax=Gadus morhua TaxID=8049 RepID=A0A8C5C1W9_GADMO
MNQQNSMAQPLWGKELSPSTLINHKRSPLNQLTRTLLRGYDSGVRPVQNWTSPTVVYIDLILQSILNVDGKTQSLTTCIWYRQIWTDEFLVWDPEEFDGITEISLLSDAIWVPDVIVSEFVDEGKSPPIPYVYVNSSGLVKNYRPVQAVLACKLELYAFPFDKQNCTLTFRSWLHSVQELDLALWRSAEAIASEQTEFMNDGEWELLSIPSHYWQLQQAGGEYAHIQFNVLIRRRPLLYVVGLLIPSIFLMLVDVMSFYLPINSGTRVTFKTSTLLGYTVFRVNLMDELPATAVTTPLIGVFFAACMALLMLSLAKSILAIKLLHHGETEVRLKIIFVFPISITLGFGFDRLPPRESPVLSLEDLWDGLSSRLDWILQDLLCLRLALAEGESEDVAQGKWLVLCAKVDRVLFRVYLFILVMYTSTLVLLWLSWGLA